MLRLSKWLWLLLSLGGAGMLLILVAIGIFTRAWFGLGKLKLQPETTDLRSRTEVFAGDYLKTRTNGALVIAVIQKGKIHWIGRGRISDTNANPPDLDTIFEIGSVTKVFTGVLFARMMGEGKVELNGTLRSNLPARVALPPDLEDITLRQLATHTAGLPRLPSNLKLFAADPYADYTPSQLYDYLSEAKLERRPGMASVYSNLGVGLLGHILEIRSGVPYEKSLRQGVLVPLGMTNTAIRLTEEQRARFVPGHRRAGEMVAPWTFSVLAPAGALRSCASDLLSFVQANLDPTRHAELQAALEQAQESQFSSKAGGVGLCWQMLDTQEGHRFHWHNGGTAGFVSFVGFDRTNQTGVVLLSNYGDAMAGDHSLDDIGMSLLRLAPKLSW